MDAIQFICPLCSHRMSLPASVAGKQGKCPQCAQVVTITASAAQAAVLPPPSLPTVQPDPLPQQPVIQQTAQLPAAAGPSLPLTTRSGKKPLLVATAMGAGLATIIIVSFLLFFGGDKTDTTEAAKAEAPAEKKPVASLAPSNEAPDRKTNAMTVPLSKATAAPFEVNQVRYDVTGMT